MSFHISPEDKDRLQSAFQRKDLSLYLGAGVSVANGLPDWEKLVLAMYFSTISEQYMNGWKPYSNYLYAIAEWYLDYAEEPLEITARKLRKFLSSDEDGDRKFVESLYSTLYSHFLREDGVLIDYVEPYFLRDRNATLRSVAELCEKGSDHTGVRSVITYNYDDLLETILQQTPYQSIFRNSEYEEGKLPIYHVHGFVPLTPDREGSKGNEIVFTEDQYHTVARDPYYWSNLIQVKTMANSVGIMIGLSLADRNMRRLLDAVTNAPIDAKNYALLQRPANMIPNTEVIDGIHATAIKYYDKFENSGIKSDRTSDEVFFRNARVGIKSSERAPMGGGIKGATVYQSQIAGIIEQVQMLNEEQQNYIMQELGITPIWYDEHSEIPEILNDLFG